MRWVAPVHKVCTMLRKLRGHWSYALVISIHAAANVLWHFWVVIFLTNIVSDVDQFDEIQIDIVCFKCCF